MNDTELGKARAAKHNPSAFAGLLDPILADETPRAPMEAAESHQTAQSTGSPTDGGGTAVSTAKPRKSKSTAAAPEHTIAGGSGKDLANQAVQISLPSSLEAKLETYKKNSGLSHPFILFEAIEATIDDLPQLVQIKTVQVSTETRTLFNRPTSVSKREASTEPRKTFIVRITQENKGILDQLWKDVGAPNRNVMIVAAYESFLATKATQ